MNKTEKYIDRLAKEKKLILTDADGVLLNWDFAFHKHMDMMGYKRVRDYKHIYDIGSQYKCLYKEVYREVANFNMSAMIGFLPPLRDAQVVVKRLTEEGYRFHVITSMGKSEAAATLRRQNLKKLFGKAIVKLDILGLDAPKKSYLKKYKNTGLFWLEDKVANAEVGADLGLKALVVEHGFNMNIKSIPLMKTWEDIYNAIKN